MGLLAQFKDQAKKREQQELGSDIAVQLFTYAVRNNVNIGQASIILTGMKTKSNPSFKVTDDDFQQAQKMLWAVRNEEKNQRMNDNRFKD